MKTEIKKVETGHEVFINGKSVFWVYGSKKHAEEELKEYIAKCKQLN